MYFFTSYLHCHVGNFCSNGFQHLVNSQTIKGVLEPIQSLHMRVSPCYNGGPGSISTINNRSHIEIKITRVFGFTAVLIWTHFIGYVIHTVSKIVDGLFGISGSAVFRMQKCSIRIITALVNNKDCQEMDQKTT